MTVLSAEALLEIRGLRTWFPIRKGVLQRVSGHVRAVDGVDLTVFRRRDAGAGRGVGLRQDHGGPHHPAACGARPPAASGFAAPT